MTDVVVTPARFAARDAALYALSIGLGRDPLDPERLRYVCTVDGTLFPTAITALPDRSMEILAGLNIPLAQLLHGAEHLTLHRPILCDADLELTTSLCGMGEAPSGRGTLIDMETRVMQADDGMPLAIIRRTLFLGGQTGLGPPAPVRDGIAPPLTQRLTVDTASDQALLFRLNGDLNPLHSDPEFARRCGFPRPILHGLCSFGVVAAALMRHYHVPPDGLRQFAMRFRAPIYPGETLEVRTGQDAEQIFFTVSIPARGLIVADQGIMVRGDA